MLQKFIKIGLISISDRASSGVYEDKGIPELEAWLKKTIKNDYQTESLVIPDEFSKIKDTLIDYCDHKECALILTTGGTGPAERDITPEVTLSIADKEMSGFGEQMRQISLNFVPTAILSRQVAVIRKKTLIVNLPGQPKAIVETLEGVKDKENNIKTHGIFAAIPYCLDLIGGPYIETNEEFVKSFRPKKK
ncbi:molybdopterin adenylyltransferase [Methylophilales bacterium]|nr:molybdopterin adenylyltransferase [Methylophilales bacterium]